MSGQSSVFYCGDLATYAIPTDVLAAAGYASGRKHQHWRVNRRLNQWGSWMELCRINE